MGTIQFQESYCQEAYDKQLICEKKFGCLFFV